MICASGLYLAAPAVVALVRPREPEPVPLARPDDGPGTALPSDRTSTVFLPLAGPATRLPPRPSARKLGLFFLGPSRTPRAGLTVQ
jgi:hypothetical protein